MSKVHTMDPIKKRRGGPSGPTKTYAERAAKRVALSVWFTPEAAERLEIVAEKRGCSKRQVLEDMLMGKLRLQPAAQSIAEQEEQHHAPDDPIVPKLADTNAARKALADKVRSAGSRRVAQIVSTGEVARDGKIR